MAYIQPIHTLAILLALIACNEILFSEGRQLKEEYNSMHGSQAMNSLQNPEVHGHGYDLPAPQASHVPIIDHSVAGKKDTPPTTTFNQSLGFDDSSAVYKDDFRPTTPGNSPGVGHSFSGKKDDAETNKKSDGTVGDTDDFRPTIPGHSPGVGHYFQNANVAGSP